MINKINKSDHEIEKQMIQSLNKIEFEIESETACSLYNYC